MRPDAIPHDFEPLAALVELGADLIHVGRWVVVKGHAEYFTTRTSGGLGVTWADRDGLEAVWLCWCATKERDAYPKGASPEAWRQRLTGPIHILAPRGEARPFWRAFTVTAGPSGRSEPDHVVDHVSVEEAIWTVVGMRARGQA